MNKEEVIEHVSYLLQEVTTSMEIVKDDHKREQRFKYLAKYMVEKAIEKDGLIVSENGRGVAILYRTNSKDKNFWKDLVQDLKLAINVTGIRKGLKAMKNQKYVKDQRPKEGDYLYCWFWGILPDSRGSDDSKTAYEMKNRFYEIAKELQLPIYAESRNRRISLAYRRYGFELFHEWNHPSGDVMYFLRYLPPAKE
ncbi:hypothetical protein LZ575_08910 [Antarcticibacterium sp. 1MA-6-2]|uniref:hypothetical protein n=1 Tax=Antarcticibacterium sp. 1MA-6-2 TaxID=2908210 RepID=UPI001F1A7A06|nr:hypothetical protein [Antarcticibacterium sp. 1MA-6-2]UJH92578.1 hypothetical protein LZ575_08910 [Antarcticibacterium sp. 1MA-6-2]